MDFASTVNGDYGLTVSGDTGVAFGDAVGAGTTPANLSVTATTGAITIGGGSVNTTGAQTYNDAVTLDSSSTLTSSVGAVDFASTVNGDYGLTVSGDTGVTFGGAVGAGTTLANLTVNAGTTVISSNITTTGFQLYNGALVLQGNSTLQATGDGNIMINDGISGAYNLTIDGGSQNNTVALTGALAVANITIGGGSGNNNMLTVQTGDVQTWNITGTNAGNMAG